MKKKLILADCDEMYLDNLANYFMEKAQQFEIATVSKTDTLKEELKSMTKTDILAIDERMADSLDLNAYPETVKIILSVSMNPVSDCEIVKKYQKTETLLNEILMKYAEATGAVEVIRGKNHTKTAVFYSPVGGSGKTTFALALAAAASKSGLRTFYLNLEGIDSVKEIFAPTAGSMTDVMFAMKTKGMRADIKLASSAGKDQNGGFYYLSGVESIFEYNEISAKEVKSLIDMLCDLAEYDLLILDLDSGFSMKTQELLARADVIFATALFERSSVMKLCRFLRDPELAERLGNLQNKLSLVMNKVTPGAQGMKAAESELYRYAECCAMIAEAPIFEKWDEMIKAGEMMKQVMEPLLQKIREI